MISKDKTYGNLRVITVTDTGVTHRIKELPNQDAILHLVVGQDYVLAVSDGVGSCPLASLGSRMAVNAAVAVFQSIIEGKTKFDKKSIIESVISNWFEMLTGTKIDDYCATLKAVMKLGNRMLLFSVGDGFLAMTSAGMCKSAPAEDWLFSNQTMALNQNIEYTDFWVDEITLDLHTSYAVFICTDGVANNIRPGSELDLVREIEMGTAGNQLRNELESFITEISDYSSDDRTVGVIKYEWKNAEPHR